MVIIIMGAAGAGKTTIGRRLSEELQWAFLDGDAVHSPENVAKMARGTPLTDEDRGPWLQALRRSLAGWIEAGIDGVLACSLLTPAHRFAVLAGNEPHIKLVYLKASRQLLHTRLTSRTGHFAGVALLDSQLTLLEEPPDALAVDASQSPDELVRTMRLAFNV
jgi:gluconokinase